MKLFLHGRTLGWALLTFVISAHLPLGILAVNDALLAERLERPAERSKLVSLCEIVSHPERYHRRKVRIKGIYRVAGQVAIYDLNCSEEKKWVAVEFSRSVKGSGKELDRVVARDRRATVVFEGTFFGPEPVPIDPKLPQALKVKLRGMNRRYGHLDAFETMIRVSSVRHVEEVASSIPW
jgi:hypothetical protein